MDLPSYTLGQGFLGGRYTGGKNLKCIKTSEEDVVQSSRDTLVIFSTLQ